MAENIRMYSGKTFKDLYVKYFTTIGLMRIKQGDEENIEIETYDSYNLELTVLGELVNSTKDIYLELKKNEVFN